METGQEWTLWKLTKTAGGDSWRDETSFAAIANVHRWEELQSKEFQTPNQSLHADESFFLFKRGIEPRWEDAADAKGGRAVYIDELNRGANRVNEQWEFLLHGLLLAAAGGNHPLQPLLAQINGVQVDIRHSRYRIAVWVREAGIGAEIRQTLNGTALSFPFASSARFEFKLHSPQ